MDVGGNSGGGVLSSPVSGDNPFSRQARLNAAVEQLRSQNWDVTGSLTRAVTSEEEVGQTPNPAEEEADADH